MLISDNAKAQQQTLHESGTFGTMGEQYAPLVAEIVNRLEVNHLLDYGCGSKLSLAKGLRGKVRHAFQYQAYDPCVPEFESAPVPAQMVAAIDVLEHIEPDRIDDVLDNLYELVESVGFFTVACRAAKKTLPDGRNAHLIQQPPEWWLPRLMARWELQTYQVTQSDDEGTMAFYVIVYARPRQIEATDGTKLS